MRTRCRACRALRGGGVAFAVLALVAAVLAPAASAQTRTIGTVVVANGWSSADSAVASALAALESDSRSDAVVLYATTRELTSRTANFIEDHDPSEVILVGGTAALSAAVEAEAVELVGSGSVRRIEGRDRFDTAAKAVPRTAITYIIANGYSAADTGVAAALAATRSDAAVLLANADSLTEHTERIIRDQPPLAVEFVGGTAVLAESLVQRVLDLAPSISRIPRHSGATRTATAAAAAPDRSTTLVIANGWSPADMGVAAAYAAITSGAAVLYSQTSSLTTPTENRIQALRPRAIVLVGGGAALDTSLHARLRTLAPQATLHRISGSDRIDTAVRAADGRLTAIATDPPAAPTSVIVVPRNAGLTVSWTAPTRTADTTNNNDPEVTGYALEYRACTAVDKTCRSGPAWSAWRSHTHVGTRTSTVITGLTNGIAHQVHVRARNSAGLSTWSQTASGTPLEQTAKPSVPSGLTLEAANRLLKVTWTPSVPPRDGTVSGYEVQYRRCPTSSTCTDWMPHSHSSTDTTTTITGLNNGIVYEVRVQASSSKGDSGWSPSQSARPAQLPGFERAPALTASDRQIVVQWNEPADSGSPVSDYDVQYRACTATDSDRSDLTCDPADKATWGSWRSHSHTGTAQLATITGLTNGTVYQVQVRATNSNGAGPWSIAGNAKPISVPARPNTPAVEAGNELLVVTWTAPFDNGLAITGYDVQRCTGTCATNSDDWTDTLHSGTVTRHEITGLVNGTSYKVRVRAINDLGGTDAGMGPWSGIRAGTPRALPDAPAAPTLVASDRQIAVTWVAPALNGTTITSYDIQYRACTATPRDCSSNPRWGSWRTKRHTDTTTLASTITSLTNATKYEVQVRALISGGQGPYSAAESATPLGKPAKPATPTLTPGNATLVVTWKAPADNGSAITRYEVAHCVSTEDCGLDGDWSTPSRVEGVGTDPPATTETISSLNNGTTYRVRVRAVNSVGDGPWSSSASGTPSLRPDAPAKPDINPGDRKFSLSWGEPSGNGQAITGYVVAYRACTATDSDTTVKTCATVPTWGNWAERSYPATSTAATISGLTNGTKYEAQVRARNANGLGPWSPSADTTPLAAPSTPTGLTLEPSHLQLEVSWNESASRGSTISGYVVEYRDCTATRKDCTSSPKWNEAWTPQTVAATATTTTIDSLTNDTAYQVRVRATSDTGDSGWSQIKSAIPAAVPASPATPTLAADNRQLRVNWVEPEDRDSAIEHYEVAYRACTATDSDTAVKTCVPADKATWGNWRLHGDRDNSLSRIITGLTNGTAYQVRVRAQNEKGWGPWTATPAVGTPVGAPAAPTTPIVTTGDTELDVTWIIPRSNGSTIDGYDVRYRACTATNSDEKVLTCASNPTWATTWETHAHSDTSTSTTIGSLTNGTAYQVRVRAKAGTRESPWSQPAVGMPRGTPDSPVMTLASGNQRLIVTWPKPNARGSTITSFELRYCDSTNDCSSGGAGWVTRTRIGSSSTTYTISGLTNGNSHSVEMRTISRSHGDSDWTSPETATPGGPNPPSTPRLTAGNTAITVTWTAPAKNHSDISTYDVAYCNYTDDDERCSAVGGDWQTPVSHTDLTSLSATLTSLTNGKSYRVRVRALNAQGAGAWSPIASATPRS